MSKEPHPDSDALLKTCTAITTRTGQPERCSSRFSYKPGDEKDDPICYRCRGNSASMREYASRQTGKQTSLLKDWFWFQANRPKNKRWTPFCREKRNERITQSTGTNNRDHSTDQERQPGITETDNSQFDQAMVCASSASGNEWYEDLPENPEDFASLVDAAAQMTETTNF
ncbi:uncharacterized protein L199_001714 [Kwoniella botswanensis]|uniref:uncharacterized protein n=1 Tax=Kwoniella botswanensis TaxID=1268659 RepID=UPI00315C68B2